MRIALLFPTAALAVSVALGAGPKVAVMYSSWPEGAFGFADEYDDELRALGWTFEEFENTKAAELVARLGEFDMVLAASVANHENPQDLGAYADQWLAFLQRGGCLLITDASYGSVLDLWVNKLGEDFPLTTVQCASHREGTPESRAITVAEHPLMTVPNDLALLLQSRTNIWAHLDSWSDAWQSLVTCSDGKSLLLARPVGKGMIIVTSYYSFRGAKEPAAMALLENLQFYRECLSRGLAVDRLVFMPLAPGPGQVEMSLSNRTGADLALRTWVQVEPDGQRPIAGQPVPVKLKSAGNVSVTLPFTIATRGKVILRVVADDAQGERLLDLPRSADLPPAIRVELKRKHLYPRDTHLEAKVLLLPDAGLDPASLRLEHRVDASAPQVQPAPGEQAAIALSLEGLGFGKHSLGLRLLAGDRVVGETTEFFFKHPQGRVSFRPDGATLVEGKPFFPFGFYHVSWTFTAEQRLKTVQDLAAAGFNVIHCGIKHGEMETYGEFLDECARLGVYVITEFGEPMFDVVQRYRDKPAVLGWNPGDEPDGQGVDPREMYARYDRLKQLDPEHLVYTVLCVAPKYGLYARGTEVVAPDPYPIPNSPVTVVYDLLKAAHTEAVRYDTVLWGVLQCFGNYGSWKRPPTAQELRAMTYLALLAGVKGIIYYTYQDGSWLVTDNPEQWETAKALVPEITRLAPALLDGAFELLAEKDSGLYAGCWTHQGRRYVVIVNGGTETVDFELTIRGAVAEKLFGDAATPLLANGKLKGSIGGLGTLVALVSD
ncbi:MAG: hypothetical protein AB7W28_01050 [Armatimonadota bacterium]